MGYFVLDGDNHQFGKGTEEEKEKRYDGQIGEGSTL